jgi:heterodisulfide reductase subunit A
MGRASIAVSGRGPRRKVEPPYGRHNAACWTCGACISVCPTDRLDFSMLTANSPVPIPYEYNMGLDSRPAIHIPYPQAVPNKPVIDPTACVHLLHDQCGVCEAVCQAGAIHYGQQEETLELTAGAVILAPGYEVFDAAQKPQLGYGRFPNVITALEFERILSASGPFCGKVARPSDHRPPKRIAFIQCVGSREHDRDYCSAVCCMYATKEALIAKEHAGEDLECDIFFMDLRAFGKGFEAYYQRAVQHGVRYIRCRPASVEEVPGTGNLRIEYLGPNDRKETAEYDLVVLSTGLAPPKGARELAERLEIQLNELGFCGTGTFTPVESSRPGVFVAGPFSEPKDIPETVMQASAAASRVLSLLAPAKHTLTRARVEVPERDVTGEEPRVGVFVCHCGTNIAGVVDVPAVVEYAKTLPGVVYAENNLYTCSNDTQERIKEKVKEHGLNRVVVASCSPRTHEPLFRNTCREAGLNEYLFEMANIRDQCSWVHMLEHEPATRKAKDLVRMALAKSRLLEPLQKGHVPVEKAALVIGGGLSGMVCALELANQGFSVCLAERENELGGNLRRIRYLLTAEDPRAGLESVIEEVRKNRNIRLFTGAKVESIEGSIGSFKTRLSVDGDVHELAHGVVVVATGAKEYRPTEYLYGADPGVLTQLELEERLAGDGRVSLPSTVVMIQCVGSRDAERPYCSRVCCSEAIKNALRIKQLRPETAVYVLFRDVRAYGFAEAFYTKARQQGVVFVRFEEDRKPEVARSGDRLQVSVYDPTVEKEILIPAGWVVLSAGTVADAGNKAVAQLLKVPLNQDAFFLEAHMKLRPVDFATDGVFLAGLAHSAKSIEESIIQAGAAAARAGRILSRDSVELEASLSCVRDDGCDGCAYCIAPCPYKAITLLEYARDGAIKKIVEVNESLCKGCGTCQATCPKGAIFVKGFRLDQIQAQVSAALETVQ